MERVTVQEAAEILGISKQAVRVLMQKRKIDIGFVAGDGKKTYVIFRAKLEKLTGREIWSAANGTDAQTR